MNLLPWSHSQTIPYIKCSSGNETAASPAVVLCSVSCVYVSVNIAGTDGLESKYLSNYPTDSRRLSNYLDTITSLTSRSQKPLKRNMIIVSLSLAGGAWENLGDREVFAVAVLKL